MFEYIMRRLGFSVITLLAITILVFLMIHLIPGDPVQLMMGEQGDEQTRELMRQQLGLDKPLHIQYVHYMSRLVRGDMGVSLRTRNPVMSEVLRRSAATIELGIFALFISTLIAIPAGIVSATKPYSAADYISMSVSFLGISMPSFWVGLLLMMVFSLKLSILPALGRGEPLIASLILMFQGEMGPLIDSLRHLILPAVTLGLYNAGFVARMTRSSMLEVLNQEYINTVRSKGVPEYLVVYKHAFRNALLPIVTVVGLQFGFLMGGSVLTETVFAWPGLGRFIVESILTRDYPLIQGGLLFFGTVFLVVNLLTDLLYGFIDPRVRYE